MAVTGGLITLADAKLSLGIATAVTIYDSDLERYIEAATPVVENLTGPILAGTRTFTFQGGGSSVLLPVAFNTVTSVTESGVAVTDFTANPSSGIVYAGTSVGGRSFASGRENIVVTVTVGGAEVPAHVKLATRELVRHWWQIGRQASIPGGAEQGTAAGFSAGYAVPDRVKQILAPTQNVGGFA